MADQSYAASVLSLKFAEKAERAISPTVREGSAFYAAKRMSPPNGRANAPMINSANFKDTTLVETSSMTLTWLCTKR